MKTTALATDVNSFVEMAKKKEQARSIKLFTLCFLSSTLGGTVSTLMSVYLPVAVKDLMPDQKMTELESIQAYEKQ